MDFLTADGGKYVCEIKKSKFTGRIKKVCSEEEAREFISAVKKEESLATHNCYAYIVLEDGCERMRYSDDGEPKGTAGLPILNVLKTRGLYNVAAVVTRYFGGIKLGAGGLLRAYSETCAKACDLSRVVKNVFCDVFGIDFSYENYRLFSSFKFSGKMRVLSTEYGTDVKVTAAVPTESADRFIYEFDDFFNKKQSAERLKQGYYEFEDDQK